jgi:hypothetical protein
LALNPKIHRPTVGIVEVLRFSTAEIVLEVLHVADNAYSLQTETVRFRRDREFGLHKQELGRG